MLLNAARPSIGPRSKLDFVYQTLKEAILSGRLKPNDPIVQSHVAKNLNVSPIPVMAAVQQLIAEGLVVQEPHHQAYVAPFSRDGAREKMVIRMHLEVLATRTSVPHATKKLIGEMREIIAEMAEAMSAEDLPRFGVLNKSLHLKLYSVCPYRHLVQLIVGLWDETDRAGLRAMFSLKEAGRSHNEHIEFVDLIEAGKADEAAQFLELHKAALRDSLKDDARLQPNQRHRLKESSLAR